MSLRQAAQQALEALDLLAKSEHPATNFTTKSGGRIYPHKVAVDAGAALRTALAEPEQEPVAWYDSISGWTDFTFYKPHRKPSSPSAKWIPLYTHPPQRKPLTDEEIELLAVKHAPPIDPAFAQHDDFIEFVRAVERAHGIGGEA
jgi:hypothetical protein